MESDGSDEDAVKACTYSVETTIPPRDLLRAHPAIPEIFSDEQAHCLRFTDAKLAGSQSKLQMLQTSSD